MIEIMYDKSDRTQANIDLMTITPISEWYKFGASWNNRREFAI